jgi:hypothetical protein
MSGRHIARRGLIACSALLLVAGEAGAAKAQEMDGKLIALCREFQDAEVTFAAWDAERDFMPFDHPRAKEIDKLERALVRTRKLLSPRGMLSGILCRSTIRVRRRSTSWSGHWSIAGTRSARKWPN